MKKYISIYHGSLILFSIFIAVPIIYTFTSSFLNNDSLIEDISSIDTKNILLLIKSILIATIISLLSTIMGTVLAFILYKTDIIWSKYLKIFILAPLFISPYILAVAWRDSFYILFGNTSYISSILGVIIVLTTVFTPLAILITGSALSHINSQLEESAMLIVNFKTAIIKIILPLIKPALLSSFVLIFIFSISNFSVPAYFGVKVFTTEIFTQFSAFYNHSLAIMQSILLVAICIGLLFSTYRYIADAPFFSIGSKGSSIKIYKNKGKNNIILVASWIFISMIFPLIILVIQSLTNGTSSLTKAFKLLTPTFANSFILAFIASIIIVTIGFIVAYWDIWKKNDMQLFNWILLIVFTIPSTIYGISLIKFYNQSALNFIYTGYAIIIIAYVGKFSFIASRIISNTMKQIPQSLNESAIIQGIHPTKILIKILIPLSMPAIFGAFIISFILTLGELGTTIMVYPPGIELMPIKVYTIMANAPQSLTSSMILIVFTISLIMISGFSYLASRLFKNQ